MRSIAPCASCHGGIDQKPGSPWLDGDGALASRALMPVQEIPQEPVR